MKRRRTPHHPPPHPAEPGHHGPQPGRSRVGTALLLAAVLLPPLVGLGAWLYAGSHPLLPGLQGCGMVRNRQAQIDCYSDAFRSIANEDGLDAAVERVDEEAKAAPALRASCHLAWHPVGEEEGRRIARRGEPFPAVPEGSFCQQGYLHGVMIGYLDAGDAPSAEDAERACGGDQKSGEARGCMHSFGHAFARAADYDADRAIGTCQELEGGGPPLGTQPSVRGEGLRPGAKHECMYAVYMELSIRDTRLGDARTPNNCVDAPEDARLACIEFLPARVAALDRDEEALARACEQFPSEEHASLCARSVGDAMRAPEPCNAFRSSILRRECIDAARA